MRSTASMTWGATRSWALLVTCGSLRCLLLALMPHLAQQALMSAPFSLDKGLHAPRKRPRAIFIEGKEDEMSCFFFWHCIVPALRVLFHRRLSL